MLRSGWRQSSGPGVGGSTPDFPGAEEQWREAAAKESPNLPELRKVRQLRSEASGASE